MNILKSASCRSGEHECGGEFNIAPDFPMSCTCKCHSTCVCHPGQKDY